MWVFITGQIIHSSIQVWSNDYILVTRSLFLMATSCYLYFWKRGVGGNMAQQYLLGNGASILDEEATRQRHFIYIGPNCSSLWKLSVTLEANLFSLSQMSLTFSSCIYTLNSPLNNYCCVISDYGNMKPKLHPSSLKF